MVGVAAFAYDLIAETVMPSPWASAPDCALDWICSEMAYTETCSSCVCTWHVAFD